MDSPLSPGSNHVQENATLPWILQLVHAGLPLEKWGGHRLLQKDFRIQEWGLEGGVGGWSTVRWLVESLLGNSSVLYQINLHPYHFFVD